MKQIKNNILLVFIVTFSTVLFSQQRGNNRNSSQQQGQSSQMAQAKVNPQNMARIIMYDYEAVIKKLKIKKEPKKSMVIQAINKHNNKINEIKTFNFETFDDVSTYLTKKRNEATLNRDFSTIKESQIQANGMLAPIREKVLLQKNTLNTIFEKELSEKQYKTWLKYQESELKKLNPKAPQTQQIQSRQQSQRGSRQQQGMSRGGY
ncbi:hypothetical protein [uncultured Lutibacter sp.]|uniref:hypothetical protein n=1 Tax=uncultured Lutibacter sp. TaxID=437739 RepID=UPI002625F7E7|nr:hypothetical protein [uncultured Lutibacter sp.]